MTKTAYCKFGTIGLAAVLCVFGYLTATRDTSASTLLSLASASLGIERAESDILLVASRKWRRHQWKRNQRRLWFWDEPLYLGEPRYAWYYDDPDQSVTPKIRKKKRTKQIQQKRTKQIQQGQRMSCEAAADLVAGYAFSEVKPIGCSGKIYRFQVKRETRPFSVTLNSTNGELVKVKKLKTALP